MTSTTLDFLDTLREQDARVQSIYDDVIGATCFKNPPELALDDLHRTPATRGWAAVYTISHEIHMDTIWAEGATDAEVAGCLTHELAHAAAGIEYAHGPRHQEKEDEFNDRLRCHGITVTPAPTQGGVIRANDWRTWMWLLSWSIPLFLVFPTFLLAVAYWRH